MALNYKSNGTALKMTMLAQEIGLVELEKRANISRQTATNAVNGKNISSKTCNKIAKALGVPVTDLFTCD